MDSSSRSKLSTSDVAALPRRSRCWSQACSFESMAGYGRWQAPIFALCAGNTAVFWLFARAVFDDGFEPRWRHAAVWGALAGLGLLEFFVLVPARSPLAVPVGVALSLASLGFAILAVVQTISGWRTDLIEGAAGLEPRL